MICKNCLVDPICTVACDKLLTNIKLKDFHKKNIPSRLINNKIKKVLKFEENVKVKIENNISYHFFKNGKLHREDGPAIEFANGNKYWWIDGKRHREDGPAIEYNNGNKEWWINGKLHREDGPAVEC